MVYPTDQTAFGSQRRGRPKKDFVRPDKPLKDYSRTEVWREGERLATEHLQSIGLDVIEHNWRCKYGEVDIVAMDDDRSVRLFEVKCRIGSPDEVYPELAVSPEKLARYERMTKYFLARHPDIHSVHVDVIAVNLISDRKAHLRRYSNLYAWDD